MDLSYQEKRIAGSLIAMLVVYGYYFAKTLNNIGSVNFDGASLNRLIFAVIAIMVIEAVYHIALAIESKPEAKDERDKLISAKAYRNAYFVLASGTWMLLGTLITASLMHRDASVNFLAAPFVVGNLVLLLMLLAELVKFGTQLFCYRRGF
jgi:hypothetical protein